jgi:hypothetical protein
MFIAEYVARSEHERLFPQPASASGLGNPGSSAGPPSGPRTQMSTRACRVEHDLIVLPELLDKPAGLLIVTRSRGVPKDRDR